MQHCDCGALANHRLFLKHHVMNSKTITHLFLARQEEKIFSFLPVGRRASRTVPKNPAPASCLFSTRKSRFEVPERRDFGEENCLGKGGVDKAQKGKKDAQKKSGL